MLLILLTSLFLSFTVNQISIPEQQLYDYSELYKTVEEEENNFYIRDSINDKISQLTKDDVISFYTQFTNNRAIAEVIVTYGIDHGVPVNILFSIAWKESRYNPRAVNTGNRNGSIDWGLFQLNNQYTSFTRDQFLNIYHNTNRAAEILSELIEWSDGDIIRALYSYNAGFTRVSRGDIPASTHDYVTDVLDYEDMLNQEFNKWVREMA
jgi:hypothetical protein